VPDSTYENVGGLDKQIKEIKEVIELPVKHPELFDALGIAQPKVCGQTVHLNYDVYLCFSVNCTAKHCLSSALTVFIYYECSYNTYVVQEGSANKVITKITTAQNVK